MTLSELSAEAGLRARHFLSRSYRRLLDDTDKTYVSTKQLARALHPLSISQAAERIRTGESQPVLKGLANLSRTAALVKQHFPDALAQTVGEADAILNHHIALFGRPHDFGERIDWHADPEVRVRWPLNHFTRVPIVQGKLSDARVVWELNRLHHLTTLGRAYALTKDERYTSAFINQLTSWCEANPPRFGINWTVAMEVAIRAVNLVLALGCFRDSPLLTDVVIELCLKTLLSHGQFIKENLEFSYRVTSNHYLSDLIGLFTIGTALPDFRESRKWVAFSAQALLAELRKQVLADGADDEASIGYHRLVCEIFSLFFVLQGRSQTIWSNADQQRLEAMFEFTRAYLKPDGQAPILGDSDDGRLLKLKERPPTDHGYLLSFAAIMFEKAKFKLTPHLDEEALWWFGEEGLRIFERLPLSPEPQISQAFVDAQIFIQRHESLYAVIDCGDNGLKGRGSHAHADALSIELFAYAQTFLRDPGTYVYTTSKRWRHLFRSTAYHNTVRIDRTEIQGIRPEQPFSAGENVRPKVNAWLSTDEYDLLDAEHDGYSRLAEPVIHRRILTFHKREAYWLLEDHFTGTGQHLLEFCFHFDAGLQVTMEENHRVIAANQTYAFTIMPLSGQPFETRIARRWVSPSYRTRLRSSGIIYRLRADVPCKTMMLLIPYALGEEARVLAICRQLSVANNPWPSLTDH